MEADAAKGCCRRTTWRDNMAAFVAVASPCIVGWFSVGMQFWEVEERE